MWGRLLSEGEWEGPAERNVEESLNLCMKVCCVYDCVVWVSCVCVLHDHPQSASTARLTNSTTTHIIYYVRMCTACVRVVHNTHYQISYIPSRQPSVLTILHPISLLGQQGGHSERLVVALPVVLDRSWSHVLQSLQTPGRLQVLQEVTSHRKLLNKMMS